MAAVRNENSSSYLTAISKEPQEIAVNCCMQMDHKRVLKLFMKHLKC